MTSIVAIVSGVRPQCPTTTAVPDDEGRASARRRRALQ
jgi:hypothetical protein